MQIFTNTKINLRATSIYSLRLVISIAVFITFTILLTNKIQANSWKKYSTTPVFSITGIFATTPTVTGGSTYQMYFSTLTSNGWNIGKAISNNGINWNHVNGIIIPIGSNDNWEDEISDPKVLKIGNTFHMWYTSTDNQHWSYGPDRFRTRYAYSTDGTNWVKTDGWVLKGTENKWDSGGTARGRSIVYKDGKYHMWYAATNNDNLGISPYWRIGYATSNDGTTWTKMNNGNPVINPTKVWELQNVSHPNVIYENNKYKMWYGVSSGDTPVHFAYAESVDGINWLKPENMNPSLTVGPNGSFDDVMIADPFVLKEENILKMYYAGYDGSKWSIGYATKSAELNEANLNVPLLKQTAEPWQSNVYDSASRWSPGNPTISRWGCAMTSAAMILNYHGITKLPENTTLDPGTLNRWLNSQRDGYIGNGLINWLAISRLSKLAKQSGNNPSFSFDALEYKRIRGENKQQLTSDLNNNIPGILEEPGHFIVAKGINGNTFNINDPLYNRSTLEEGYNNTFLSLGRYIPSNTDLSYIMVVTNDNVDVSLIDSSGNSIEYGYNQEPITDPITGLSSGSVVKILYAEQPITQDYTIEIIGNSIYNLDIYLYDKNGEYKKVSYSGILDNNDSDNITIQFDKENSENSNSVKVVTFETIRGDIKRLQNAELIKHGVSAQLLVGLDHIEKSYDKNNKKGANMHIKVFENKLNNFKGKGIEEAAYNILKSDFEVLKSGLEFT